MSTNQASEKATNQQTTRSASYALESLYDFLKENQVRLAPWQMSAATYLRKLEERNFYENLGATPIGIASVSSQEQPIF